MKCLFNEKKKPAVFLLLHCLQGTNPSCSSKTANPLCNSFTLYLESAYEDFTLKKFSVMAHFVINVNNSCNWSVQMAIILQKYFFFFFKQELLYPPTISKTKKPKPNSNDQNQYWPLICSGVWMQALEKYNTLNDRDTFISSLFWSSLCFLHTFWWNTAIKINH